MPAMIRAILQSLSIAAALCCHPVFAQAADVRLQGEIVARFAAPDANQGVAVDAGSFYAINNRAISGSGKVDGSLVARWRGDLAHLDSGVIYAGKLYAAHSNYPAWPMASSVEIWDAESLAHESSVQLSIENISFTWLDRYNDAWWGAFAGYDLVQPGQDHVYGGTASTRVVRMDAAFNILERWTLPASLLERLRPMSNSGGSWGQDGYLYLTGHDLPEIYVMALPGDGSELRWVATVTVPGYSGQGIAWDRSAESRDLWGINRAGREVLRLRIPVIGE